MEQDLLDPEIVEARRMQAASVKWVKVTTLTSAEARSLARGAAMRYDDGNPNIHRIKNFQISVPGGSIHARLYQPANAAPDATIYAIHCGAWFV